MRKTLSTLLVILFITLSSAYGQAKYGNDRYGFSGWVPEDWTVYGAINHDPVGKFAIIDWGLPKEYSKLEKDFIENSISITAYKKPNFNNMDELIKYEFSRVKEMLVSKERIDSSQTPSYLVMTQRNGLTYKSKVVFALENDVGYIMNFTATQGTYDINLPKFEKFVNEARFSVPNEPIQQKPSDGPVRFDGLYIAKTHEIMIGDNKTEIYNYIRFSEDGYVYTQSVTSYDPQKVVKWLGMAGRFERKGKYNTAGARISFNVSNDESPDKQLEGPMADQYSGKVLSGDQIYLEVIYNSGSEDEFTYEFVKEE